MKNKKGLSYIEVIIFIVILGVAIPPLLIVAANMYEENINLETSHIKNNLVFQKMEDTISKDFDDIVSEPTTNFSGQFNAYEYQIDVDYVLPADLDTAAGTATDYKRIIVRVRSPGVGSSTTTLRTVVANE